MSEHTFSPGPNVRLRKEIRGLLERVAERHGLALVTYPAVRELDPQWALTGPTLGRFEDDDIEDRVRAELNSEPAYCAWCAEFPHR